MPIRKNSRKKETSAEILNHSSPSSSPIRSERRSFKGFHTSITSTFTDPSSIRIDCCSISCCGIFQHDYNRYLLLNRRPPTWKNRFIQYVLIPFLIFCAAGTAAVFIPNPGVNQAVCTGLLMVALFWVVGGCFQSTQKKSYIEKGDAEKNKIWLHPCA